MGIVLMLIGAGFGLFGTVADDSDLIQVVYQLIAAVSIGSGAVCWNIEQLRNDMFPRVRVTSDTARQVSEQQAAAAQHQAWAQYYAERQPGNEPGTD